MKKQQQDLITTSEGVIEACKMLAQADQIAIDTEFIRETTFFPILALIQVASKDGVWLFDPIALEPEMLQPLFAIFRNPKILKILHAAQADQECLFTTYGMVASPSFDTAIGAALLGLGDSIGLGRLLAEVLHLKVPKGHARTDWTKRPLPAPLIHYAVADVDHLIPLTKKLFAKLEKHNRLNWALELSAKYEDESIYKNGAEAVTLRLGRNAKLDRRAFAALKGLVTWREKRAREADVPRRRIMEDAILTSLAMTRPSDMEHLAAFRGLGRSELKHNGHALLEILQHAEQLSERELPVLPRVLVPNSQELRILDLMQNVVKLLADRSGIATKYLVQSDSLLELLRNFRGDLSVEEQEDLCRKWLSPQAADIIGSDLAALLGGRLGLCIRDGSVALLNT